MACGRSFTSLVILSLVVLSQGADETRQPGGNGASVVDTVVSLIRESCLFADDKRFLRRLAYVQSHDGTDPKTYRAGYDGGIWQVGRDKFIDTQNKPALLSKYAIIRDKFGIDWSTVSWSDLRKPLYSGIAAALYTILGGGVGWRIEDQAQFYSEHYLTQAGNNFTNLANILDQGCKGNEQLDLVFVVDRSNSLSTDDYTRTKYFIENVVDDFNIAPDKTRVAVVSYSSDVKAEFYLNTYSNKASVKNAVDNMVFKGGTTATASALDLTLQQVFSQAHGSRPFAVKVMIVITDGESDDRLNTMHAAERIHNAHIVTFAIGVGSQVNNNELNTIGTNPSCTHVFTVTGYDDIKAMKEEIQKSSCRAPVYIPMNTTYTCVVDTCPPLAVITPPGGVTVETNVTCGNMNLYTAFGNPYPGKSYYEVVQGTTPEKPGTQFRNTSTTQTLFMSVTDALELTHGSKGCVINVTPYRGDHRDHEVKCFQNGVQIKCPDDCEEHWGYGPLCTKENILANNLYFPHPTDPTKYLMCDLNQKLYVVQCPQNESYYDSCKQCVGKDTPCIANLHPLGNTLANPCSAQNILEGHFFFVYPSDKHKFIHCDVWGKAWVQSCPAGEEWDQHELTCIVPTSYKNPCHNITSFGPFLFTYPCDPKKYIQCDLWHESFVRDCNLNYYFDPSSQLCVPPNRYHPTNPPDGTVCDDSMVTSPTSAPYVTLPPIYTPAAGVYTTIEPRYGYSYCKSCPLYTQPCTKAHLLNREFLFPIHGDIHHYIQCDLRGNMYYMSCTNGGKDYFDTVTHTCTDGSLSLDNLIGK